MLDRLSHIKLIVDDVGASEKFYREQLGFKVQFRRKGSALSCIELGGAALVLEAADQSPEARPGEIYFGFELESRERFEQEVKTAVEKGAEMLKGPEEREAGRISAVFKGMNGEKIEVVGPLSYETKD